MDDRFDIDVGDRRGEVEEFRRPRPAHIERARAELETELALPETDAERAAAGTRDPDVIR